MNKSLIVFLILMSFTISIFAQEIGQLEQTLIIGIIAHAAEKWPTFALAFAIFPHIRALLIPKLNNKYLKFVVEYLSGNYGNAKNQN